MTSFPAQLKRHIRNTIGHTKLVPGLYRHLDYPDVGVAGHAVGAARDQRQQGRALRAGGRARQLRQARRLLRARRASPTKSATRLYDTPHEFNAEMQAEAWGFLQKHLGRPA